MTTITIDTYALISSLKDAGVPETQAKATVDVMAKFVDTAREQTRHDFRLDEITTNKDLDARITQTELKIKDAEMRIITQLSMMQQDIQVTKLTNRALLAVCSVIATALIKMAFFN